MKKKFLKITLLSTALAMVMASCSEECDKKSVLCRIRFYAQKTAAKAETQKLNDTLYVYNKTGNVLLANKIINVEQLSLPLHPINEKDTLVFRFVNKKEQEWLYHVIIDHENQTHFESSECPVVVFHHITGVKYTLIDSDETTSVIDSVQLNSSEVNYGNQENLHLYLHTFSK